MTTKHGNDRAGPGFAAAALHHAARRDWPSTRRFPARPLVQLFFGLFVFVLASSASAHSFNVAFVASQSGPRADQGRGALDGFLLATGERDGHPNETSDGHLGGLDVFVFRVDDAGGPDSVRRHVRTLSVQKDIRFVFGVFEPELDEVIQSAVSGTRTIVVDPTECAMYRASAGRAERMTTMSGQMYSVVFRTAQGYDAGAFATNGYIAARLIDAAVRAAEPGIDENGVLKEAYDRACEELQ